MKKAQREEIERITADAVEFLRTIIHADGAESMAGRVFMAGYDFAAGDVPCGCPECTIAISIAMSIGADRMARMDEAGVISEADGTRVRWNASQPPGGVNKPDDYRTIARNLRTLYPL